MKIAVGASSFADMNDAPLCLLEEKGIEVIKNPYGRRLSEEEIVEHLKGADGLLAGLEPLTNRVFDSSPDLKVIARIGIGMDNVDMKAAQKHGIKVSNTPEGPTEAVAEMTLAAMLMMLHQIVPSNEDIHAGIWKKRMGKSIVRLKVFVVGCGHIGRRAAELLQMAGAEVRVYDKYLPEYPDGIQYTDSLEEGLQWADAVTLHVSGTDEVIGKREINMMKRGGYLLNSARGSVVNEDALYEALDSGKIAGFWGDTLWQEPYAGKIINFRNAILTPHISTYTEQCRLDMETEAVQNLLRDLGYGEDA